MAALTQITRSTLHSYYSFPVSGGGYNLLAGTPMIAGAVAAATTGIATPCGTDGGAAGKPFIGLLADPHIYASCGDATNSTLGYWYPGFGGLVEKTAPVHRIELADSSVIVNMDYALSTATGITLTGTNTTTAANGSVETTHGLAGGWLYGYSGTSAGQLGFIADNTASTSYTTYTMTLAWTNNDVALRIYPAFYRTPVFVATGATVAQTLIDSTAAAGTGRGVMLGQFIVRNGLEQRLDPKSFHNLQGLNSLTSLRFFSQLMLQNTIWHPNA